MPALEVDGLRFQGRGPYAFRLEAGECVGLQGPSGAGKSLLLRAIADLDPRHGAMRLGEMESDTVSGPAWRRLVGLLPAESGWWLELVGDHFPDPGAVDEGLLAAIGFNPTVLQWQVSRLSTGEKQRLAIARLLHNGPRCLLLDEPTASLDQSMVAQVEEMLLSWGRTNQAPILWVSHDPAQLERVSGRRFLMETGGQLVEKGSFSHER